MTDPKLTELRALRAASGQTDTFADHRATYEDATEEELFVPPLTSAAKRAARETDIAEIRVALTAAAGNVAEAARALHVERYLLDRRISGLGLRTWLAETFPALRRSHLTPTADPADLPMSPPGAGRATPRKRPRRQGD